MRTVHDVLRESVFTKLNLKDKSSYEESLENIERFVSEPLIAGLRCLVIAQERYGKLTLDRDEKYDYVDFIERRFNLFKETGNREWLIDVMNGAILEYQFRSHPNSHMEHHDDHDYHQERLA
jgi:hypothetical protein